jgi:hypothetical protein
MGLSPNLGNLDCVVQNWLVYQFLKIPFHSVGLVRLTTPYQTDGIHAVKVRRMGIACVICRRLIQMICLLGLFGRLSEQKYFLLEYQD